MLHNKVGHSLFSQNSSSDGVVFVVRGNLSGRLEANDASFGKLVVSDVHEYEAVGYIDLLFDDPHTDIMRDLYRNIVKDREKKQHEMESMANIGDEPPPPAPPATGSPPKSPTMRKGRDSMLSKGGDTPGHGHSHPGSPHSMSGKRAPGRDSFLSKGGGTTLGVPEAKSEDDMPLPDKLPRPLQSGMYITYSPASPLCEILVLDKDKFKELLYPLAIAEFQKRLDIVEGCGVFKG